jgi:hypothetical protein
MYSVPTGAYRASRCRPRGSSGGSGAPLQLLGGRAADSGVQFSALHTSLPSPRTLRGFRCAPFVSCGGVESPRGCCCMGQDWQSFLIC